MWLAHVQLLDSALPIGAFSHSFGLETLVQQGKIQNAEDLKQYVETMLWGTWAAGDAMGIKAVYEYVPQEQWLELWEIDQALHVQRMAKESREGLQKMGKRLLRLSQTMYPRLVWGPLLDALATHQCYGAYPVVYGWITYQLEVPVEQAVQGYLYNGLIASMNNAVRLMALGQTEAQVLLATLLPQIEQAWREVESYDPSQFYNSNPLAEIAMMQHESLYSRLFMS
ncbi:MAG: urease accessory protein UreF [Abitibacteriaceae bacterium]|nr:urease accessory protein UreF [Abditibacteriaceae bacterium]